ncbi:MAG: exodeoxyribonuclease VII large subunit [Planctomycetota bacterium]|nr:MAG: exodeoxyribonuclease VII large subunit [Planctomycetota bacterium]
MAYDYNDVPDHSGIRTETVNEITLRIKGLLESKFTMVAVQGELSGGKPFSSGHFYGSLKDEQAKLNLTIWRNDFLKVRFQLEDGLKVVAYGKIQVYPKNGAYSLIVSRIEPMGQGALDLAFRQICDRLRSEGLFDEERKRALPEFPRRVAVITSVSGAALRDFWRVVSDRWPLVDLIVIDSLVQGDLAAAQLTRAMRLANQIDGLDLIVLTRGGGSREDLWPFNDESLAYAIAASQVPVVSAVGHEVDTSVSDLVADYRAATPTHAATTIFPESREVLLRLDAQEARLRNAIQQRHLQTGRRIDDLDRRLVSAGSRVVERASSSVQQAESRLKSGLQRRLTELETDILRQAAVLESLSPLKVLSRGYSVTLSNDGTRVIRSVSEIQAGETIVTRLPDGRLTSRVEDVLSKV